MVMEKKLPEEPTTPTRVRVALLERQVEKLIGSQRALIASQQALIKAVQAMHNDLEERADTSGRSSRCTCPRDPDDPDDPGDMLSTCPIHGWRDEHG